MNYSRRMLKVHLLALLMFLLTGCTSEKSWASNFVVWDGYIYEVSEEFVDEIGEEIGAVTNYSDTEGTYTGNFSNHYEVGTKYYAISGIDTDEAIAVEEDGQYRKAVQRGKYGGK